jgi:hypothetical protein
MADPVYDRIDLVTLTAAIFLAAGIVFLLAELVPQLVDLMMMPPPFERCTLKIAVAPARHPTINRLALPGRVVFYRASSDTPGRRDRPQLAPRDAGA